MNQCLTNGLSWLHFQPEVILPTTSTLNQFQELAVENVRPTGNRLKLMQFYIENKLDKTLNNALEKPI